MPYEVKILADSRAPNGKRLTTWSLTYPRFVHSELMTHRLFSRNSASSRAIPTAKLLEQIKNDPAMPVWWGKNQSGMQAREELTGDKLVLCKKLWLEARDAAVDNVKVMSSFGLHKQIANRILEPFMFITVIMSATELDNWFLLRAHPDAQPEIGWVATEMKKQYGAAKPLEMSAGQWHLPLIDDEDWDLAQEFVYEADLVDLDSDPLSERPWSTNVEMLRNCLIQVSVARCARVSYLRHNEKRDFGEDIKLHDRLLASGHMSPFEHVAQAMTSRPACEGPIPWSGNLQGFRQYRELVDRSFVKVNNTPTKILNPSTWTGNL